MNNLVNAELAFCEELSVGMETYIRPLQAILPESTHTAMFLGLSEVIMRKCIADLSHQPLHSHLSLTCHSHSHHLHSHSTHVHSHHSHSIAHTYTTHAHMYRSHPHHPQLHSVSQEISSELKRRKMPFDSPAGSPLPFYVPRVADVYWSKVCYTFFYC